MLSAQYNKSNSLVFILLSFFLFLPSGVFAATHIIHHSDPLAPIIFGVTGLFFLAVMGRYVARKLNQPTVVGELVFGIVFGNILYYFGVPMILILRESPTVFNIMHYVLAGHALKEATELALMDPAKAKVLLDILTGPNGNSYLQASQVVDGLSRYGVLFLLFLVGLDSRVSKLKETGMGAIRVAMIGVVIPITLGFFLVHYLRPNMNIQTVLYVAATLAATSVSISARTLKDMNKSHTLEAYTILGAAVIDDILGLFILAVVSTMVLTGEVGIQSILTTLSLSLLFLVILFWLGRRFLGHLIYFLRNLNVMEAKLFVAFFFVSVVSWLAHLVGLATIIGAFVAGLLLQDAYFRYWGAVKEHQYTLKELVAPLEAILVPMFFILIGMQVKLESFEDLHVLLMAFGLFIVGVIGKLLSGFGVGKNVRGLIVGVGMMPRGEVGLVFASLGKSLGVIPDQLFSAMVIMIILTTLMTPPWLNYLMKAEKKSQD